MDFPVRVSRYHAALTSWLMDETRAGMFYVVPLDGHRHVNDSGPTHTRAPIVDTSSGTRTT